MDHSTEINELATALAKAQKSFKAILRDKTVRVIPRSGQGQYTFSYAPLENIMAAVKDGLSDNGLAMTQGVVQDSMLTTLLHTSGQWLQNSTPIIRGEQPGPQAYGSALTYARRYGITSLLGVVSEEDDDANAAEGNEVSKPVLKAPIKPTDGVEHAMTENVLKLTNRILDAFALKDEPLAYAAYCDAKVKLADDTEGKIALWTKLDSKMRSTLKRLESIDQIKAMAGSQA